MIINVPTNVIVTLPQCLPSLAVLHSWFYHKSHADKKKDLDVAIQPNQFDGVSPWPSNFNKASCSGLSTR